MLEKFNYCSLEKTYVGYLEIVNLRTVGAIFLVIIVMVDKVYIVMFCYYSDPRNFVLHRVCIVRKSYSSSKY